jgi:ABC-type lipoprotein export system ATPase subunit
MGDAAVSARGVTKIYRRGQEQIKALRGVDLEVEPGSFVAILGPSGGGKSTLLHLLGAIDLASGGELVVCGVALHDTTERDRTRFRREKIGFIFQSYNLMPALSALDNVALPLLAQGQSWKSARRQAGQTLESTGLGHRLRHTPGQLSGGEQQRVAIARALVGRPGLVLADEPTGDLDSDNTVQITALLVDLNRQYGITLVVATHNQAVAQPADCMYSLRDGMLYPDGNRSSTGAA